MMVTLELTYEEAELLYGLVLSAPLQTTVAKWRPVQGTLLSLVDKVEAAASHEEEPDDG